MRAAWKPGRRLASWSAMRRDSRCIRGQSETISGSTAATKATGSAHALLVAPGTYEPSTAKPECSVVNAKRPVAACRCAARRSSGRPAASTPTAIRRGVRPAGAAKPAAASSRGNSTTSISCRIATAVAYSKPAATGADRSLRRRERTARQASATVGSSTQLSCASTPDKTIWPGHAPSATPASERTQKGTTPRQSRKGTTASSPVRIAVARRAIVSGSPGSRSRKESTSGRPGPSWPQR